MSWDMAGRTEAGGYFATTHWSIVLEAQADPSPDADRALETLCRTYWPSIHGYVCRTGVPRETARDLTQEFFARLLEKKWLDRADRERGKFRSFLLTYLKRFLSDESDRERAIKRGGHHSIVSLDELTEQEANFEPSIHRTPEQEFDRQWSRQILRNALKRLRTEVNGASVNPLFAALEGHLPLGTSTESMSEIANRFNLGESSVKMRLKRWRSRYAELLWVEVASTVPKYSDAQEELRYLMESLSD